MWSLCDFPEVQEDSRLLVVLPMEQVKGICLSRESICGLSYQLNPNNSSPTLRSQRVNTDWLCKLLEKGFDV